MVFTIIFQSVLPRFCSNAFRDADMSQSPPHGDRVIETVDLSHFNTSNGYRHLESERLRAGKFLVESLHSFGFVNITGHGLSEQEMEEALAWTKRLFDLPYEEKMKAPHPAGSMPHRGYSGIGKEKIYSHKDVTARDTDRSGFGDELRKISDFKVRCSRETRSTTYELELPDSDQNRRATR